MQDTGRKIVSYQDLEIYNLAHDLAVEIHRLTLELLPRFEMYEEGSQIRRSAKSITAAIVEGFGRKDYQQDFARFVTTALASSDETKHHLKTLFDTGSLTDRELFIVLMGRYEELGRKLYRFRESIYAHIDSSR